ncbi:MAG: hypothetical protein WCG73_01530 [Candidatus Moraniibacteriota bacterium]
MKKEHKKKYKKELGWDEKLLRFAIKAVGSAALFLVAAFGMDAYRLLH